MMTYRVAAAAALAALLGGCYPSSAAPGPGVKLGDPAPDFTLTDRNADSPTYDQQRSLSEVRGKVVILYFLDYT